MGVHFTLSCGVLEIASHANFAPVPVFIPSASAPRSIPTNMLDLQGVHQGPLRIIIKPHRPSIPCRWYFPGDATPSVNSRLHDELSARLRHPWAAGGVTLRRSNLNIVHNPRLARTSDRGGGLALARNPAPRLLVTGPMDILLAWLVHPALTFSARPWCRAGGSGQAIDVVGGRPLVGPALMPPAAPFSSKSQRGTRLLTWGRLRRPRGWSRAAAVLGQLSIT